MSKHIALIEDGKVINVILADEWPNGIDVTDIVPRPAPGWLYDGVTFYPDESIVDPEDSARHITRLAFRNRFTNAELIALEIAGIDDPTADMTVRQQAAALRVMQRRVAEASFIDLDHPDTRAGVLQLEGAGLISAGRALEILDAAIQPMERY